MIKPGTIAKGDVLKKLVTLPDGCVRGVVTSPPYNMRGKSMRPTSSGNPKAKGKWKNAALRDGYEGHDDAMPNDVYVAWQRNVLSECMRVTEDDGAIFYNHKWRIQNGLLDMRIPILEGFPVRQVIIWKRSGGFNFNPGYFVPVYEVIYLIAKPGFRMPNRVLGYGDVWTICPDMENGHPAPFPVAVPFRCIEALGRGLVLDPFMGSGSTAVAAKMAGVPWIGIERSAAYIKQAKERLAEMLL